MNPQPVDVNAYKLIMDGSKALSEIEHNGMKIDVDYLDSAIKWSDEEYRRMSRELKSDSIYEEWKKRFGGKTNIQSHSQLATVLFEQIGMKSAGVTRSGKYKTDKGTLDKIKHPFVKKWTAWQKLGKAKSTYLVGLRREVDSKGFLHPFFNLHTVSTFRSSSSQPNFQNQPVRDAKQAKLIRRSYVPRTKDHFLVEVDYGALEFRGAANFWQDPKIIEYANNPELDIHRDMAAHCYSLPFDQVDKITRYYGKNQFVFPILYGSYYKSCAENLWSAISLGDLKKVDGTPMMDHLTSVGLGDFNEFQQHVKMVEQKFHDMFPHWSDSRERWWKDYLNRGWFRMQTGFVCSGVFSFNDLMNYPIQGASFHLLLWSMVRLHEWLKDNKPKSFIVGQIHDSIVADVHRDDLQDYLNQAQKIMTLDVRENFEWIKTDLDVEPEVAYPTWYDKKPWVMKNGEWAAI